MTRDQSEPESANGLSNAPRQPSPWSGTRQRRNNTLGIKGALLVLIVWIVISGSGFAARHLELPSQLAFLSEAAIPQAIATLTLALGIIVFGWRDAALGASKPGTARLMWFPTLYLFAFAAVIAALGAPPINFLVGLAYSMFWIAASEELMFRGLLFPALRRTLRIWPAIGLTSLIFGAVHLMNALGDGDFIGAVIQTIAATMTGFLLLALRLRRGSIWPAIFYHMAWNIGVFGIGFAAQSDQPQGDDMLNAVVDHNPIAVAFLLLMVLPNAVYAFWLLRHAGTQNLPGDVQLQPQ